MTEIRGQCPSHSGDTGGSDSYFWNPDKKQGHCKSCDLSTWEFNGVLYGKNNRKTFRIDGEPMEAVLEDEEDFTPKAVVTNEYQPWRGITEATLREFNTYSDSERIVFPYPSGGTKTRMKADKQFYAKSLKADELFGMNFFPSGCSKKVTITEGECFTPDTEVFTPSGWVSLENYNGELVLQVYPDRSAGFTNPVAVVDKQFKGNLVEYVSGSYYSLTTPSHNLVREHPKEGLKKFKASKNSYFNVPRTFSRRDTHADITALEAKIWVMLSADFTFRKEGDIYGALKKERKAKRAKELLDQYGVRYSMNRDARDYWSIFIHRGHNLGFVQKDLPFCLSWHPDKEEILKEVIFWDGNYVKTRNQAEFSSNRKHNIDVVQMLAHSCGYVSTIIYRSNDYGEWMKASILFSKTNSSTQKGYNSVPYDGRVMCLTVETGMLVVRQKGSISISGNCDALSAWQMLQSGRYLNPVVSLPSATPSGKLWEKCKGWLDSFEEIILSVDNDGPGKKIAEKISLMFPGKVKVMDHGQYKDANDFLMNGEAQAYKSAWWAAKRFRPDDMLVDAEDYLELYDESPDFEYFPTGIPELDEKILGINKGYFTVIQAPTGVGKCLHPDQGVMMWDGSIKKAKDVFVGDKLMGDDSTPRNVLGTTTGEEEMFEIIPVKGSSWVCNKSHMLSVVNTSTGAKFEISVSDYLKQNKTFKHEYKLYRAPVVEFGYKGEKTRFNPYLVGVYLGDGHAHRAAITLGPKKFKVMQYVEQCLSVTGHKVSLEDKGNCTELTFKGGAFWKYIKTYIHRTDRCIPNEFKFSKDYYRAALLAGLLDTDGSLTNGGVEITQKSEVLANDIAFVARSLGLAAYVKPKVGEIKSLGFKGQYYRVGISGDFSGIPFRRLNVPTRTQVKDVLRTGFTVKPLGVGKYAGFELDGNHRFLLDDFTVTHNSEFMRYLEWQCLTKSEFTFAYMHLEESRLRSLLGLVSYKLGSNVTLKKFIEEKGLDEEVREAIKELASSDRMIQFSFNPEDGYESLIDKIKYLVAAFEVDYVFFEPIQDLVHGEDKEGKLADLASRLGTLASDLDVGIVTIAHQNQNGDTMYATMIGKKAAFEITLHRDQEAEDHEERNRTRIKVGRKNRVGLGNGPAGALDFDVDSYTLIPVEPPTEPKTPEGRDDF